MRSVLTICEVILVVSFSLNIVFLVIFCIGKLLKRNDRPWSEMNPIGPILELWRRGQKATCIILSFILVIGFCGVIAETFFSTTEIGSFLEKSSFEENYEATIYAGEKPIFCIVNVWKEHDKYGDSYYISYINLPYGKSDDIDQEYYPERDDNTIDIGDNDVECKIVIRNVATEYSYELLKNEVVTAYGKYCGSKDGEKFHSLSCVSAKNIKDENMIFFESETEAYLFGYDPCENCFWWA